MLQISWILKITVILSWISKCWRKLQKNSIVSLDTYALYIQLIKYHFARWLKSIYFASYTMASGEQKLSPTLLH